MITNTTANVFRPIHNALTLENKALYDAIKAKAQELHELFDKVEHNYQPYQTTPHTDYSVWASKDLQSAVMWAIKALTA